MKIGMEYCEKCYPNACKAFYLSLFMIILSVAFGFWVGRLGN